MTVDTEMPVFETTDARPTTADTAGAQELLHTMAAVVRTVFGVALQAPAEAPAEQAAPAAVPAQLAPVSLSLPPEAAASIAVDFPPVVSAQQTEHPEEPAQPIGLAVVPDSEPATSLPMPSISLGDSSWAPAPPPPAPAASLAMPVEYPASIPVPAYAAPVAPEPAASDRHSLALLQEIAFLDD